MDIFEELRNRDRKETRKMKDIVRVTFNEETIC